MQKPSEANAVRAAAQQVEADRETRTVDGVSVIVPIYNEVENLPELHRQLTTALADIGKEYEIIFVDDGSTDGSLEALRALAECDQRCRIVAFRRNYGQTAALKAGIDHASLDVIVTIDGDLQNDPADVVTIIEKLEEGYDLVHGWRKNRQDDVLSRILPSRIANWLISRVTHFPIHDLGCTLKGIRRDILSEIDLYGDMHRFIPILLFQRGARCAEVVTNHRSRQHGTTKYGIGRTAVVILDLVTVKFMLDYADHPMRLFGGLALMSLLVSLLAFVLTVGMKVFAGQNMTGNPLLLLTAIAGLAGLQFLCVGILGEVLARIYYGGRGRTHYAVRERVNFDGAAA